MPGNERSSAPLSERSVSWFDPSSDDLSPGRRLRVFAALVSQSRDRLALSPARSRPHDSPEPTTYGRLLRVVESDESATAAKDAFSRLPLRVGASGPLLSTIANNTVHEPPSARDPELHPALQDLANEINEDIRDALDSLDDPRAYYPGVDQGIELVSDEHVSLVIWAMQRELNRELRAPEGFASSSVTAPAAPLAELPWNVQRALVERRRLRFKEWGIDRNAWERGEWSLWEVPADIDYVPRRAQRLALTHGSTAGYA